MTHGLYERRLISKEVKDTINLRWISAIYLDILPERIRLTLEDGQVPESWTWLDPTMISTEELTAYLLGTVRSGTGRDVGDQKHELVNQWIRKQALIFSFEDLQGSWEKFFLGFMTQLEQHIPDGEALDKALHKGVVKELHNMVKRSCENPKTMKNLAMGFLLPFQKVDDLKTIDMAIGRMRAGYEQVMKEIVTSSLFNEELFNQILHKPQNEDKKPFEGDQKSKDKGKERKREREINRHLDPTLLLRSRKSPNLRRKRNPSQRQRTKLGPFAPLAELIFPTNTTP
jgi:hypothetical protein